MHDSLDGVQDTAYNSSSSQVRYQWYTGTASVEFSRAERLDRNTNQILYLFKEVHSLEDTLYPQLHAYQLLRELVFILLLCNKFMQNTQISTCSILTEKTKNCKSVSSQIAHILLHFYPTE